MYFSTVLQLYDPTLIPNDNYSLLVSNDLERSLRLEKKIVRIIGIDSVLELKNLKAQKETR